MKCKYKFIDNIKDVVRFIVFYINSFFSVELKKLKEGFGKYVDRNDMQKDKALPSNSCLSVFVKRDVLDLPEKFFSMAMNPEFRPECESANGFHYEKNLCLLSLGKTQTSIKY